MAPVVPVVMVGRAGREAREATSRSSCLMTSRCLPASSKHTAALVLVEREGLRARVEPVVREAKGCQAIKGVRMELLVLTVLTVRREWTGPMDNRGPGRRC